MASSMMDSMLDETMEMQSADTDRLVQEATLQKLRTFDAEIVAYRADLERLRTPGAGMSELRLVVEQAVQLQAKMNVSQDLLTREVLIEAGIPVEEIEQARSILQTVQSCDRAQEQASSALHGPCQPSVVDSLASFLDSHSRLRQLTSRLQQQKARSAVACVDLQIDKRNMSAQQLCEALLDKVCTSGAGTDMAAKISQCCSQDWVKQELAALAVDTSVLNQGSSQRSLSPSAAGGQRSLADKLTSQSRGRSNSPAPVPAPTSDFGRPDMHAAAPARAPPASAFGGPQPSTPSAAALSDALQQQIASASEWPSNEGRPQQASTSKHGTPELWQAVHVGDEAVVQAIIKRGECDGSTRDASGHSVLWHSVAFNHMGLAKLVVETFPPGTDFGVDVTEIHQRRGDTFLHLLCQARPFVAETAQMFKRIALVAPAALVEKANAQGLTFLHIACSTQNFWVIKFTCQQLPRSCKAMACSQGQAFRALADTIPIPKMPTFSQPKPLPEHFPLAQLLGSSSTVPFADVAFDVGDDGPSDGGRFLAHRVVVGAQSTVMLEELQKLEPQHLPQEGVRAAVFRVDPRISKEAWRTALQFLYTGVINCPFEQDAGRMVELLRACTMYKLPKPLLDYAQVCLFQLLPQSPPMTSLQAFSLAAGNSGEDLDVRAIREAATHILLRSAPQVFDGIDHAEVAKILDTIVQTVEEAVFNPAPPKSALKKTEGTPMQQQGAMQQQMTMQQQAAMQQQGARGTQVYDSHNPASQAQVGKGGYGADYANAMYGGAQSGQGGPWAYGS